MSIVTIEEAQAKLQQLIDSLKPGEEIIITKNQQPVAKLVGEQPVVHKPREIGIAKDKIIYMAEDFDEPLDDLRDYTE